MPSDASLTIGSIFQGGYEVLAELGAGSFGRVYAARQLSTGQEVAIKILRRRDGDTPAEVANQIERFRREMRLCAQLSHPNLVRLIDSGQSDEGQLYAVFQYVPGSTLSHVLATEGKLRLRETVHLMSQVLDALSCAHAHGVVHRDLKPENIMITKTGVRRNALVLDLGLGGFTAEADNRQPRLTATYEMMGTPCYAAPEQLRGEAPSTRSDLYSWGLIFLECLTGELAVGGASAQEVVLKQLGPDPVPIPATLRQHPLGRLLQTVTAKQTEKRDVTIEGLLRVLDGIERIEGEVPGDGSEPNPLAAGERRQLSFVCCRLTVTSLDAAQVDLEEVDQLLHVEHAKCAELAGRSGGQIASVMADRILLVFGFPHAREDDARRAARTALLIAAEVERANARLGAERRVQLDVRIGVHTGVVIVRDLRRTGSAGIDGIVGLTPQIANELVGRANAGEVLVSDETRRLLRDEFRSEQAGALTVSELSGSLPVFRLVPKLSGRAGLETLPLKHETPLVGRTRQLGELFDVWTRAQAGNAGAVFVSGEPGIGKSRLVRELRRAIPPEDWLECRCVVENQDTPLRPLVDLLASLEEPLEGLLTRYGFDLGDTVPLFAALLSRPLNGRYRPLVLSPERQKELTLNALLTLVLKMSESSPLVFTLEDLHWADPTTLELVGMLIQELRTAQMLDAQPAPRLALVLTARPEFEPPWSNEGMSVIQLSRLAREDVEEMIRAGLSQGRSVPTAVVDAIVQRADGIPLFVEEVTRVLTESAAASSNVEDLVGDHFPAEIPGSLRDLLTARLDNLSAAAKETAQLAAVLGREFRYEVLQAVSSKDESALRDDLADLTSAGLVFHRRGLRAEGYVFKHALVRDTAYESMMRSTRQQLHLRVANVLRQRFPDVENHRPEILARHFEAGGELASAGEYWRQAGDRAFKHAAFVEAIQQLQHAIDVVRQLPESGGRDRLEIELLTTLGAVLFSIRGHASPEVEQTFARARVLSEHLGEDLPVKVVAGIASVAIARSDREATAALRPRLERLAARSDDAVASITGHALLGAAAFWSGDFVGARDHLTKAKHFYGSDEFKRFALEYGYDGGFFIYAYMMSILWNLGYPDQAAALQSEATTIAETSGNLYSILLGLGFSATLTHNLGQAESTLESGERLISLSTEQRLYFWSAIGMLARGGALTQRGNAEEAIAPIQQALGLCQAVGLFSSYSYYLTYLAAAYARTRQIDAGLAVVNEGLARCQTDLTRFHESELHCLKGDLLVLGNDTTTAEASYQQALEVARQQRAKSLELRAAMGLSRLWKSGGRSPGARALLQDVYGWFTEGFKTTDLRAANELLAALS